MNKRFRNLNGCTANLFFCSSISALLRILLQKCKTLWAQFKWNENSSPTQMAIVKTHWIQGSITHGGDKEEHKFFATKNCCMEAQRVEIIQNRKDKLKYFMAFIKSFMTYDAYAYSCTFPVYVCEWKCIGVIKISPITGGNGEFYEGLSSCSQEMTWERLCFPRIETDPVAHTYTPSFYDNFYDDLQRFEHVPVASNIARHRTMYAIVLAHSNPQRLWSRKTS